MQCFISYLVDFLRPLATFVWGHMDDVIVIVPPRVLTNIIQPILRSFLRCGFLASWPKTMWTPSTSVSFLGAIWDLAKGHCLLDGKHIHLARDLVQTLRDASDFLSSRDVRRGLGYRAFVWPLFCLPWSLLARPYRRPCRSRHLGSCRSLVHVLFSRSSLHPNLPPGSSLAPPLLVWESLSAHEKHLLIFPSDCSS